MGGRMARVPRRRALAPAASGGKAARGAEFPLDPWYRPSGSLFPPVFWGGRRPDCKLLSGVSTPGQDQVHQQGDAATRQSIAALAEVFKIMSTKCLESPDEHIQAHANLYNEANGLR